MDEIRSPIALEGWLYNKPSDWAHVVAYRCSMRVIPVLNLAVTSPYLSERLKNRLTLSVFHASIISWVAAYSSNPEMIYAAVIAAGDAGDAVAAARSAAAHAGAAAFVAAADAAVAAAFVAADADPAARASFAASYAVDAVRASGATRTSDTTSAALSNDVAWLQSSQADKKNVQKLLALPLWQGEKNPLLLEWDSFKIALKSFDHNWQFWIDWYQAKLDGSLHPGLTQSQQDDLYYKIATLPNELWEEGAEVVNQRIAELLEEIKEEAQSASNDVVETIRAPDELDGAHLELSDGKFELAKSSSPLSKDFDKETQEILRNRIQSRINMLSEQVSRVSNQHPRLDIVIKEYQSQLENDLDELNSV